MSSTNNRRADALVESGLQKIQEGQPVQARLLCEQALDLAPRHPDALHLLGVIALQNGEPAAAIEWLQRAAAIRPDHPAYQANVAYACVGLKRYPEALAAFERAARLAPEDPELELAVGNCLGMLGRTTEAEAVFRRLVARHPAYAFGWFNLANALKDLGRCEEACELYVRTARLMPRFAQAHCNLGVVLQRLGRFEESEKAFHASLALQPEFFPAYVGLAMTLNSQRRCAEAEALCRKALAGDSGQETAWPVLGDALIGQGRWHEALRCFQEWVRAFPKSTNALGNMGDVLARTGRVKEALDAFDRAGAIGTVSPFVSLFKASLLFSLGRVVDGAAEYIGRNERLTFIAEHPERPIVSRLPHDLAGREAGLVGEQGIGDELFFLRYAPQLKLRGCRIHYCGHPKITGILARHPLFERASSNFGAVVAADNGILIGDLPHLLARPEISPCARSSAPPGGDEAAAAPRARFSWHCRVYWPELPPPLPLQPLPDRVAFMTARLRELGPPPYVGVTWRAGTEPQERPGKLLYLSKQVPLDTFAAALRAADGTLVSLQRLPLAGETERLAAMIGRPLHDVSAVNENLEDMLALLAVLDDYVGVSNTNMHLRAGAGRPGRVLVPWPAEWRWMAAGETSPWFPGFHLYRQRADGDWSGAMRRLGGELAAAARGR